MPTVTESRKTVDKRLIEIQLLFGKSSDLQNTPQSLPRGLRGEFVLEWEFDILSTSKPPLDKTRAVDEWTPEELQEGGEKKT